MLVLDSKVDKYFSANGWMKSENVNNNLSCIAFLAARFFPVEKCVKCQKFCKTEDAVQKVENISTFRRFLIWKIENFGVNGLATLHPEVYVGAR
jgi:hypothetical protein